jgi:xanthine phosphoribosyltransferase
MDQRKKSSNVNWHGIEDPEKSFLFSSSHVCASKNNNRFAYAILPNHHTVWSKRMELLKERILKNGRNLGNGVLKVDGFINHQVDPALMDACAREFATRFKKSGANKVLTAEISGIAPALLTALHLGLPIVYARKTKPVTMPDQVFLTLAPSHTKGRTIELIISPEFLCEGDRVIIIDDFLASGQTILGLVRLAQAAGAQVIGIGALIEKTFDQGRKLLEGVGVTVETLAVITDMNDGKIVFAN